MEQKTRPKLFASRAEESFHTHTHTHTNVHITLSNEANSHTAYMDMDTTPQHNMCVFSVLAELFFIEKIHLILDRFLKILIVFYL